MQPYFERTDVDVGFYENHLRDRLPPRIYDAHVHLDLTEHVRDLPREKLVEDWALECGIILPVEDAYRCAAELFPGVRYRIVGLPFPIKGGRLEENNRYLAQKQREGLITAFMCVRPEWDPAEVERQLIEGRFAGFKPYPDMVSGVKGAPIAIPDYFPPAQWEMLDRHRKAVVLHIPRPGRLADDDNVRELLELRQRYPRVTIVIAHFGRSFCPVYLSEGLRKMHGAEGFLFDCSGVINPAVYDVAFDSLDPSAILFGTDMPTFFWHGKREWTETAYINITREPFSWNRNRRSPAEEAAYTLFLYEQAKAILDAMDRHRFGASQKNAVFHDNTARILERP